MPGTDEGSAPDPYGFFAGTTPPAGPLGTTPAWAPETGPAAPPGPPGWENVDRFGSPRLPSAPLATPAPTTAAVTPPPTSDPYTAPGTAYPPASYGPGAAYGPSGYGAPPVSGWQQPVAKPHNSRRPRILLCIAAAFIVCVGLSQGATILRIATDSFASTPKMPDQLSGLPAYSGPHAAEAASALRASLDKQYSHHPHAAQIYGASARRLVVAMSVRGREDFSSDFGHEQLDPATTTSIGDATCGRVAAGNALAGFGLCIVSSNGLVSGTTAGPTSADLPTLAQMADEVHAAG